MLNNDNSKLKFLFILLIVFTAFACKNDEQKPTAVNPSEKQTASENPFPNSSANKIKIKTPDNKEVAEIEFGGGAKIIYSGKTIYSESKNDEKRKYYSGNTQIAEVKMKDSDGFKVRTNDGKLLWKVKISDDKIKISDNEENQNAYELKRNADGVKVLQNETKLGEVKFYTDRQKIKVKDAAENEIFEADTVNYSASYGTLLLNKIPEELRFIIIAELLLRNL